MLRVVFISLIQEVNIATQLCLIFRVQSALSGVFISLIQEVFIATQLCIIFRVQSALSVIYITQPRSKHCALNYVLYLEFRVF